MSSCPRSALICPHVVEYNGASGSPDPACNAAYGCTIRKLRRPVGVDSWPATDGDDPPACRRACSAVDVLLGVAFEFCDVPMDGASAMSVTEDRLGPDLCSSPSAQRSGPFD